MLLIGWYPSFFWKVSVFLTAVIVVSLLLIIYWFGLVVQWLGRRTRDREVVSSIPAVPLSGNNSGQVVHTHMPLSPSSIIWYRPNRWGVNGHTTQCTSPVSVVLQCKLVSGWRANEMEISAALWAIRLGKGLFLLVTVLFCVIIYSDVSVIPCSQLGWRSRRWQYISWCCSHLP